MNPEVKKKWVEALRSGEYKQTQYFLNGSQGFCCLGVLCDLHAKETGGNWENSPYAVTPRLYKGLDGSLPIEVKKWAGLKLDCGDEVDIHGEKKILSAHNDSGRTFAEIANAIEEQL